MLKILKKHLTRLIMGVKHGKGLDKGKIKVAPAPDWQLAQMRVMMGRCPFRKDCRQDMAIDTGRVEYGALGYAGAQLKKVNKEGMPKKRVLVPIRTGVRREQNSKAATAIQAAFRRPTRDMRYRAALASPRAQARLAEFRALREVAKAKSAKKQMPSAALKALSAAAPPPMTGPFPTLRAALDALGVPKGTPLTASKLGDMNIKYGKTKKEAQSG